MSAAPGLRCDIFCAVIDNHGDLGVCWRLARQLSSEHGLRVTLWVDDLAAFAHMAPGLAPGLPEQALDGLQVRHWQGEISAPEPGDLVIEGFGCPLPQGFLQAMAAREQPPLWINLEYLSAESWVDDCHGMTSTHPRTGLLQYFWFPGFGPRTGGLLRERTLLSDCDSLQADAAAQAAFWQDLGISDAADHSRRISLFAYENAALPGLLDTLAGDTASSLLLVPAGRVVAGVAAWAGRERLMPGERLRMGQLSVQALPFLTHADYDRLLATCDLNLVRGEDSFVRAQWTGRPLLWHIYPQDEDIHLVKLDAFIARVERQVAPSAAWADAMRAWNRPASSSPPWPALLAELPAITRNMQAWRDFLARQEDLAGGLMRFYSNRVECAASENHPEPDTR